MLEAPRIDALARKARRGWVAACAVALLLGCSRPVDRPLEGARPARVGEPGSTRPAELPPTLGPAAGGTVAPTGQPQPIVVGGSPVPLVVAATPAPSPTPAGAAPTATAEGRIPVLSNLQPGPNTLVPVGPVTITARIAASSDLTTALVALNGSPVAAQIARQDPRTWTVTFNSRLEAGRYDVRVNARDQDGREGGFRWQFDVGARAPAAPTGSPSPR